VLGHSAFLKPVRCTYRMCLFTSAAPYIWRNLWPWEPQPTVGTRFWPGRHRSGWHFIWH